VCPRANDDPEKFNTTYVEECQPTHGKRGMDKERGNRERGE